MKQINEREKWLYKNPDALASVLRGLKDAQEGKIRNIGKNMSKNKKETVQGDLSKKKIALITGINGMDGSYLAELLQKKGYIVHGVIRRASDFNTQRIDHLFDAESKSNIHFGDLAQGLDALIYSIKPDEIYNLASMSHVRVSFDIPVYTGDITGLAVCRLLETIKRGVDNGILNKDIKFYQASSSEMFGQTPTPVGGYTESSIFTPVSPYGCFPAGTKILTSREESSNKNIEDVKKGDKVLSYNIKTGKKELKKVLNIQKKESKELYIIELSNKNKIECTEEHPFFIPGKEIWTKAKNLKIGDSVLQYGRLKNKNRKMSNKEYASKYLKGKSLEEIHGKAKAEKIKEKIRVGNLGKKRSYRWKLSQGTISKMKGRTVWNKGLTKDTSKIVKKYSEKIKNNPSSKRPEVRVKISKTLKKLWQNKDYRANQLKQQQKKQNKMELLVSSILDTSFEGNFRYTGNRGLFLGSPPKNPDWVHLTKDKVIEFLGRYWHKPEDEFLLKKHYEKCGYDCLIIWEEELDNKNSLIFKIKNFLYNPNTKIVKIVKITKKQINCKVYNFEVEDNNNYFANGVLVHNCAKLYGYHIVRSYRTGYGLFACNGILFNHEAPRRGPTFLTRKVTRAACKIKLGLQKELVLGNLDALRDWGHSKDYIRAIFAIMQHSVPDDFIVATGNQYTVRDFVIKVFEYLDMNWKDYVKYDKAYERPNEVPNLLGNATKITTILNWKPEYDFEALIKDMVDSDMKDIKNDKRI